jgi:hypothetical protein
VVANSFDISFLPQPSQIAGGAWLSNKKNNTTFLHTQSSPKWSLMLGSKWNLFSLSTAAVRVDG